MHDCSFLVVPLSQSDHNQLRGLPNLRLVVVLDRGGELKCSNQLHGVLS